MTWLTAPRWVTAALLHWAALFHSDLLSALFIKTDTLLLWRGKTIIQSARSYDELGVSGTALPVVSFCELPPYDPPLPSTLSADMRSAETDEVHRKGCLILDLQSGAVACFCVGRFKRHFRQNLAKNETKYIILFKRIFLFIHWMHCICQSLDKWYQ